MRSLRQFLTKNEIEKKRGKAGHPLTPNILKNKDETLPIFFTITLNVKADTTEMQLFTDI